MTPIEHETTEGSWLVLAYVKNPEIRIDARFLDRVFADDGHLVLAVGEVAIQAGIFGGERLARELAEALTPYTRGSSALHPDAYGVTYVVRETNRGWLATVFSDRIGQAAERVGVEPGTLLGLVMAHEVGHLLLGSGYHGEAGLMRAGWPDALLARAAAWKFSMVEAARIHRVLESGSIHF